MHSVKFAQNMACMGVKINKVVQFQQRQRLGLLHINGSGTYSTHFGVYVIHTDAVFMGHKKK
jgi:hypothetical protein